MIQNIQPERLQLLNFFQRLPNAQFVIPVYQRNYIWTFNKQVKKYMEDFNSVLNGTRTSHFIGIMMYLTIPKGIGFNEFSIVDGQQRLVTTFLILQALKEIAIENGDSKMADMIDDIYLTNKHAKDDAQRLKLKPLVSDDNVYAKIISLDKEQISKEEKRSNVYQNYKYIKSFLNEKYGQYPIEKMLQALDSFYFVAIPLGTEDNAQKIFETINSAGAELSKADLIRNYILMNIDSDKQEELYSKYWHPIEIMFDKTGKIESFFRMFLANRTYELPNMEDVYNVFQIWFEREIKTRKRDDILKQILRYAEYYCNIFVSYNIDIDKDIKKELLEFKKNTIEPTAPLLLEIYNLYETKTPTKERLVSKENFIGIVKLLNTYNIRRNICNLRTGVLTRIIPPMLRDILEACGGNYDNIYKYTIKFLVDNNKDKASFMPDDAYLRANLVNINAYSLRNYVKIIFEKIESYNNPAVINFNNLSIEHLMPQTPTKEWLQHLNITKEEYDAQLHRFGNLTLATHSDNSKMSNNSFEYKKLILESTGHLKMNKKILDMKSWGVEQIENRTLEIIEDICKLYPYETAGKIELQKFDIYYINYENKVVASLFEDLTVEIQPGSYFTRQNINSEINELLEDEIILQRGNSFEFVEVCNFESLAKLSEIIIEDEFSNYWELWTDSNDNPLNYELRAKIINKSIAKRK